MKTFEERYTAWIDGQLTGEALSSFEQELARRAEAGDVESAEVDKAQALGLRALLKEHLQAPALTNAEFFNHQMRERIDAEIDKAARRREAAAQPAWKFPVFAWPFARFAGVGLGCLFVAGALYYATIPAHQTETPHVALATPAPAPVVSTNDTAPVQAPSQTTTNDGTLALLDKSTPAPVDLDDIHVTQPNPASTTSASALHYDKANVLWLNNPPYLPSVNDAVPSSVPAVNAAAPAPSAAPSTVP